MTLPLDNRCTVWSEGERCLRNQNHDTLHKYVSNDWRARVAALRAKIEGLERERETVHTENARLALEHQQCHAWNHQLVHEHYALRAEAAALREANATWQALWDCMVACARPTPESVTRDIADQTGWAMPEGPR